MKKSINYDKKIVKFPKIKLNTLIVLKSHQKAFTHYIRMSNPSYPAKVAHAITLALVYTTYVELVLDEEKIPQDIIDKVRNNDFKSFIDNSHDKRLN